MKADLRRAPARAVLARLAAVVKPGGRVGQVRRLAGGMSCGMHVITVVTPSGERTPLVVRRYPDEHPDRLEREVRTLAVLDHFGVPVPKVVAVDLTGARFGAPLLVMTRLPGRVNLSPCTQRAWTEQMGAALAALHRVSAEAADLSFLPTLGPVDTWPDSSLAALRGHHPDVDAVVDALMRLAPSIRPSPPVLLHEDYWTGNVLWSRGRLTGIVDWEQPAVGPAGRDVGYARMDMALFIGPAAPDAWLRAYMAAGGSEPEDLAFWDLLGAAKALPDPAEWLPGCHDAGRLDMTAELMRSRVRDFIADALRRAGRARR